MSDVADADMAWGIIPFQQKQAVFQTVPRATSMLEDLDPATLLQLLSLQNTSRARLDPRAFDESRV